MKDGRIRLRVADSHFYPSHGEWLLRDGIGRSDVAGGFSLLVKQGRVRWLFALSQLNDPATSALFDQQIQDITALLPLEIGFRVYK
jgi:hypothetical protein